MGSCTAPTSALVLKATKHNLAKPSSTMPKCWYCSFLVSITLYLTSRSIGAAFWYGILLHPALVLRVIQICSHYYSCIGLCCCSPGNACTYHCNLYVYLVPFRPGLQDSMWFWALYLLTQPIQCSQQCHILPFPPRACDPTFPIHWDSL